MVGRNRIGEQTRQKAVTAPGDDKGILDELHAFWDHVPDTGPVTQVSNCFNAFIDMTTR